MMLSLFPAWFPTDAVLLGVVAMVLAVIAMNRSRMRMLKVVAETESIVVGAGVAIAAASTEISGAIGTGSADAYLVLGIATALLGVVMWKK